MNRLAILASVFALAVGTAGCGNSQGLNPSVDLGPSAVTSASADGNAGNFTTLAKGGRKGTGGGTTTTNDGNLAWKMVDDRNGDGVPSWGDIVTWTFTTSESEPHVDLTCSQNGTVAYGATTGFYASYPWPWTQNMSLASQMWSSGSANCVAVLYVFAGTKKSTFSTNTFTANAGNPSVQVTTANTARPAKTQQAASVKTAPLQLLTFLRSPTRPW